MQKWVWLAMTIVGFIGCSASGSAPNAADTPPAPPPEVGFGPSVASYLFSSHRLVDRELAGTTRTDSTFLQYQFTAVITAADSGLLVSFGIDSVLAATAPNIVQGDIDQAKGATYTAFLSPTGRMEELRPSHSSSPLLDVLAAQTAALFPVLPPGGLLPSQTWADTTETKRTEGGALITFRVVTSYHSHEWNHAEGRMVLPIDWDRVYQLEGTGNQFGRQFTMEGNGTASGRSWFMRDGLFAGSVSEDDLVARLEIDDLGIVTPVRQHQVDTVRVLQ